MWIEYVSKDCKSTKIKWRFGNNQKVKKQRYRCLIIAGGLLKLNLND